MVLAYALIVTEPGACSSVATAIGDFPETVTVDRLSGPYDLVVKLQLLSEEAVLAFVRQRLGQLDGIRSATILVEARAA